MIGSSECTWVPILTVVGLSSYNKHGPYISRIGSEMVIEILLVHQTSKKVKVGERLASDSTGDSAPKVRAAFTIIDAWNAGNSDMVHTSVGKGRVRIQLPLAARRSKNSYILTRCDGKLIYSML